MTISFAVLEKRRSIGVPACQICFGPSWASLSSMRKPAEELDTLFETGVAASQGNCWTRDELHER
ncbi:MAG: hypothetical protein WCQ50_13120 [Spirochaetota bacterium]